MPKLHLRSSSGENSCSFNAASHFRVAKKTQTKPLLSLGCVLAPSLPGGVCPGAPEAFSCGGGAAPGQGLISPVVAVSGCSFC